MISMLKAMIALALVLPVTAYVAGSLLASGAGEPADRGPVIISDAPTPTFAPSTTASPTPRPATTRVVPQGTRDDGGSDGDNGARVVTPLPTTVDQHDDDGGPEGDDDDSTTGQDDTDGEGDDGNDDGDDSDDGSDD